MLYAGFVVMSTTLSTVAAVVAVYGGTEDDWTQITDRMLIGAGSSYSVKGTGGSADSIIPYHNHTFTGSEVTSGTQSANHTHTVTATGTVSVKTNPTFTGSSATTSSAGGHVHSTKNYYPVLRGNSTNVFCWVHNTGATSDFALHYGDLDDVMNTAGAHTHTLTAKGSISGGAYIFTGSSATTGTQSASHKHSVTAAGTVKYAGTSGNTTGANIPPYYAVYIWIYKVNG